ncbi:MAG TPA: FAD-dependent oxidoreductase [Candidatus Limnocylindria bacterium]|nr:FAD-dependent oxidoreductase [Candidatus Limnocylindria bacterium]
MDQELSYDVVVVGGGAAGVAAALAAAATGARTALVERYGFLGGMATAGMVSTICGVYHSSPAGLPEPVNDGFVVDFARRLSGMPGCDKPVRRGRAWVVPYTPFALACLADELTTAAPALDVYLHAYLVGVAAGATQVEALRVATWERTVELRAAAVVDATGDALVAHAAGAATAAAPLADRQLSSLVFVLQHVEPEAVTPGARVALLRTLVAAEREGLLPRGASNFALGPSPQPGEVVCKLALDGVAGEVAPGRDFSTAAEQEGRRRALALTEFLKRMPGFARAFVSHAAAQVGVRESRRLVGRYELTRDDVLSGRRFPDAVTRACWPIELWEPGRLGASYEYLEDGRSYDVPLRSLQARELDNLFAAGRCLSATHEALGSARVIGTCLATGEAAGRHAATSR